MKQKQKEQAFYEEAGVSRALVSGTYVAIFSMLGSLLYWLYFVIATGSGGIEYLGLANTINGLFGIFNGGFSQAYIAKIKATMVEHPEESDAIISIYTKVMWILGLGMTIIAILSALIINDEYITTCIWFVIPLVAMNYFGCYIGNLLIIKNRYDIIAIVGGSMSSFMTLFAILFMYVFNLPGIYHGLIPLFNGIIYISILYFFFRRKTPFKFKNIITKGSIKDPRSKQFFKYSLFSTITNLDNLGLFANLVTFLTTLVLGVLYSTEEQKALMQIFIIIAGYTVSKVAIQFFSGPINVEIAEAMAKKDKKTVEEVINSLGRTTFVLCLILLVIIASFSKILLYNLHYSAFLTGLPPEFDFMLYINGVLLFILYFTGQYLLGFASFFGSILVAAGYAKISAKGFSFGFLVCTIGTPILVFLMGILGAGISTIITGCIVLPYMFIKLKKILGIQSDLRILRQIPYLIIMFAMFFFYPFSQEINEFILQLVVAVVITLIIFGVFSSFFGVMEPKDFDLLMKPAKQIKMDGVLHGMQKVNRFLFRLNPLNRSLLSNSTSQK